jgi:hypothetical protein
MMIHQYCHAFYSQHLAHSLFSFLICIAWSMYFYSLVGLISKGFARYNCYFICFNDVFLNFSALAL